MTSVGRAAVFFPALADLARRLLARNDVLATELARRVAAAESDLADGVVVPFEDLERACSTLQGGFYRHLAGDAPLDLAEVTELGRRRAEQGVPLPAVLHGFRIGFQFVWETLAGGIDPDDKAAVGELLGQVTEFWSVLDDFSTELRRSYNETVAARVRAVEAERNAHLDALLGIVAADASRQWAGAEALDLPRHGRFQVGIIDTVPFTSPTRWQTALAARGIRAVWRARDEQLICIALLSGDGPASDLLEAVTGDLDARIGLSPAFDDITAAGPARHRAAIALRSVPASHVGVRRYGDDPLATLVASAPDTAAELTSQILGPLLRLPEGERGALLETLRAWIAAGGSTEETARAVYCHRNTVRYRLRRIEELAGYSVTDPRHATHLCMAIEAISQRRAE